MRQLHGGGRMEKKHNMCDVHVCMGIRQGYLLCGSEVVCKRFVVLNHSCRYT